MTDLLIKLYDLPDFSNYIARVEKQEIVVRLARADEKYQIIEWVSNIFGQGWAGECDVTFSRQPISCLVATAKGDIAGFACHETTCRGFFGPIGVLESFRAKGIGTALLVKSLKAMAAMGYAYAIVGDGGAAKEFYTGIVEVQSISGSAPGIY